MKTVADAQEELRQMQLVHTGAIQDAIALCRVDGVNPHSPYIYFAEFPVGAEVDESEITAGAFIADFDLENVKFVLAPSWMKYLSEAIRISLSK